MLGALAFENKSVLRDVRADLPLALPDHALVAKVLAVAVDVGLELGGTLLEGRGGKGDGDGHNDSFVSGLYGLIMCHENPANCREKGKPVWVFLLN